MSKTKTAAAPKASKKDSKKAAPAVKEGRVTKASQTPKSKSKETAKAAATKVEKKSKKSKKEPTPSESSDSESEEDSESDSESSSSEEEAPVKDAAKKTVKAGAETVKAATKAVTKAVAAKADSSDSSDSDSSDSDEEMAEAPAAKAESTDSSDSDSDSSDSEEAAPAKKAEATSDSDDSSDSDSDSDDSSESSSEEAPSKKRKAETEAEPVVKKAKAEAPAAEAEGIKNLFVGNLSWSIDEEWLQREFEKFGEITGCRIITDRETGRAKGFGYVEFASAADAKKAQAEMHEYELDGRKMNVDFSTPREKKPEQSGDRANRYGDKRSAPSNTLFIGNISFNATNEVISEYFSEHGTITRVSLPTDRETGNPKGFGYVDFTTTEEATAALEALNGADIEGRPIRIDYAAAREDNGSGGRGGGFGGGRGGGRGGRGGFGDRGGRGGGRGRGGFGDRGGRGGGRGGSRGGFSTNRGGFGEFKGSKVTF